MEFYQQISKYYDEIFPAGDEQVRFLKEIAGNPPKSVLDIACGTGGYSLELCRQGYDVTASDLDGQMLNQVESKAQREGLSLRYLQSDMLDLNRKLTEKYDTAFCIGNSIVHLENLQQIKEFLSNIKKIMDNDGSLVIQIINFDRILLRDIKSLPPIENKDAGLSFERYYDYDKESNTIHFKTRLNVENSTFENVIPLYPLRQDELMDAALEAGFKKLKLFEDFNGNEFDKYNSFMLVLWAR